MKNKTRIYSQIVEIMIINIIVILNIVYSKVQGRGDVLYNRYAY